MESQNPLLTKDRLKKMLHPTTEVATLDGTINKSIILLLITIAITALTWSMSAGFGDYLFLALIVSGILAFGCVITLIFKPEWASVLAPVYAGLEGVFLGILSMVMEQSYPGIVFQAVLLTFGVAFLMLTLYRTGVIKVTEKFRTVIILATASIFLVYLVGFVMSFFGAAIPYIHESGPIGIIFSLIVVTIAALNLLLDFDMIERTVEDKAPQYMEWIGAFALLVTIIWLYIEILRLLSKVRD